MIYLVLGSNLGDREWNLEQAKALLAEALKVDMLCSQVLETEAIGFDGAAFLNQAVCFDCAIEPEALLDICQDIEVRLGRPRHQPEYDAQGRRIFHDRTIDIDIVLFDDRQIHTDRLTIPHPQLWERPYVKELLNDITI
ncbi:MAG: 2-amino-4-hydroxy-6-hydroxymethyldihydropteridine diphosphokinase [Bacteroidales bacterium]|nr:2-amino-4-hydroxy-6-hydroxymethyldihydropteridine diphosphokinase [Bacteroidales bacterium]MBQ2599754.1 2-amino-4-hydroxy-6-hydroxymethyldihydropteridine diphosphokinase [Bacteroidales bacterium]MBQ4013529.1 2-amino-4-hydroxy-6-hydroxymethyldihydropteridine diphosphokinase [Bacteroidales bacterium]